MKNKARTFQNPLHIPIKPKVTTVKVKACLMISSVVCLLTVTRLFGAQFMLADRVFGGAAGCELVLVGVKTSLHQHLRAHSMVDQWSEACLGFDLHTFLKDCEAKYHASSDGEASTPLPKSVIEAGQLCLKSQDMDYKVFVTLWAYLQFHNHNLPLIREDDSKEVSVVAAEVQEIERPGRPDASVQVLKARDMPKRGKAGSLAKRLALIHSLAHIESYAIDLSWDVMLRFLESPIWKQASDRLSEFIEDWLKIAADEARHFRIWENRLHEHESFYGAFPVHDGLWETASNSRGDLLARLAVVHMVHEARGLDVAPSTLSRLRAAKDLRSVELLQAIYEDEITHVATAVKWFKCLASQGGEECDKQVIERFHDYVTKFFCGRLKPPFNDEARERAGFTQEWYLPLVSSTTLEGSSDRDPEEV
eukprot:TRINITY_DN5662_c0_g1_i1.p1 TRINITY_DN5662_c0_g1~~TRINITY_DN5662_c0_g1_i1.p1  ORF type:complete len:421 (+),score=96.14 TRINITY_DN5662_c0_g1_i1:598-1860(+)